MLYCVAIGLAWAVVGVALERGLHLAGRATRWAWVVALAGSFVIPVTAWVRPDAFSSVAVPLPLLGVAEPQDVLTPLPADAPPLTAVAAANAFSLGDLDGALRWGWGASSAALLCVLGAAALRLSALRRRWRASVVDGREVLVSENVGPAVAGLWRPEVIVPGWALALGEPQRRLMLSHEEEHVRAADPWLLACGAAALVLMPWNPALWWQVRRLRLAVEIDCDARVLARGGTTPEYGELLLQVGRRRSVLALGAPALSEPASFLERRIRRMATALPRWRWAGAAVALAVATAAVIGACEAPRPVSPDPAPNAIVTLRPATQERVDSAIAEYMRPLIRANLERYYPNLLREPSGPPVDVWFGHDLQGQVTQAAMVTGTPDDITSARIGSVFTTFRAGNDAWSVVDRRALQGLVRANVRVVWVTLGRVRDLSAFDEHPEVLVLPWIRDGIARHYPALLQERSGPRVDLWFVADPQKRVLRTTQQTGPDVIRVGIEEIHAVFPDLDESNVSGWRLVQGRGLGKLVRDNIRVVWIQLREGKTISGIAPPSARVAEPPAPSAYRGPTLSWSPAPVYPELLRHAGIRGRVIVQAVIDAAGRADPSSVKVVASPHPGFNQAAKDWMVAARFEPARQQGRAVRALVNLPIEFGIE
jgi:TonB family protein